MRLLHMLIAIVVGILALTAAFIGAVVLASLAMFASVRRRFSRTGASRDGLRQNRHGPMPGGSGEVIDVVAHEVAPDPVGNRTAEPPLHSTHARAL